MHIDEYDFGKIKIDGKLYQNDVIIFPDHVMSDWWRKEGHKLHPEDLTKVIEFRPELLIVGKGYHGRMKVLDSAREEIESIGCEIISQKTEEACSIYNEKSSEGKVIAALHLTC